MIGHILLSALALAVEATRKRPKEAGVIGAMNFLKIAFIIIFNLVYLR
jgi:hypothetical protein